MAYTKPGVTVEYVQGSVSPNLTSPDLFAVITGKGYNIREIAPDSVFEDSYYQTYDNDSGNSDISLSGIIEDSGAYVDENSIYIDLESAVAGRKHVPPASFSCTDGQVTISGGIGADYDGARIKIGYREQVITANVLTSYERIDDVEDRIGKNTVFNPLVFGLSWALSNAGKAVMGYGINVADETTGHTSAIADLALSEYPYAVAPMTHTTSIHTAYDAHAATMSAPAEKKERVVIVSRQIPWSDASGTATLFSDAATTDKNKTMETIATAAFAKQNTRAYWVYPDVCFVTTTLHVSQLSRAYMNTTVPTGAYGLDGGEYALLNSNVKLASGTTLYKYTKITDAVWAQLKTDTESGALNYMINVLVPIPGYFLAAAVAGQRSGQLPEQPLTNLPIAGPTMLKYSGDFFSEANLNTAANGGTYWFYQRNSTAPIASRHQLSTDRSSIQKQEMSIRSSLDFCGKFIRSVVAPYIGRYTITPAFLKMLGMTVNIAGQYLVRIGRLNSFTVIDAPSVDPTASDTVLCTASLGVKYPVNNINFTFIF